GAAAVALEIERAGVVERGGGDGGLRGGRIGQDEKAAGIVECPADRQRAAAGTVRQADSNGTGIDQPAANAERAAESVEMRTDAERAADRERAGECSGGAIDQLQISRESGEAGERAVVSRVRCIGDTRRCAIQVEMPPGDLGDLAVSILEQRIAAEIDSCAE